MNTGLFVIMELRITVERHSHWSLSIILKRFAASFPANSEAMELDSELSIVDIVCQPSVTVSDSDQICSNKL
jgi:hypothetical protein